jgi:hypothetical protein
VRVVVVTRSSSQVGDSAVAELPDAPYWSGTAAAPSRIQLTRSKFARR